MIFPFPRNVVLIFAEEAGKKAKGGSCNGLQVADTEYDFVVTDRLHGPDLFKSM